MKKYNTVITVILGVAIIIGTWIFISFKTDMTTIVFPNNDKFQKGYNSQRSKLGLLPIPADWVTTDQGESSQVWTPQMKLAHNDSAVRFTKSVQTNAGKIISEFDAIGYFGSKKELFEKVIEMRFNYAFKKWKIVMITYKEDGSTLENNLNISERDSILKSWNFDYYSHLRE